MPECQKIKKGGLDQHDAERFGRLILPQSEKCGTERVNRLIMADDDDDDFNYSLYR